MDLSNLPDELIVQQMSGLTPRDILNLCTTSSRFARVCNSPEIWLQLLGRDFPELLLEGVSDLRVEYLQRQQLLTSLTDSLSQGTFDDILDYRKDEGEYEDETYGEQLDHEGKLKITLLGFDSYDEFLEAQRRAVSRLPFEMVQELNRLLTQVTGTPVLDTYKGDVDRLMGLVFDSLGKVVMIRGYLTKYSP